MPDKNIISVKVGNYRVIYNFKLSTKSQAYLYFSISVIKSQEGSVRFLENKDEIK